MLPRNESGTRKLGAENLDQCRAELHWDGPAVSRDLKLIMNLFISTEGCISKGRIKLFGAKHRKEVCFVQML